MPPHRSRGRVLRSRFTCAVCAALVAGFLFAWLGPDEEWPRFAQPPTLDLEPLEAPFGDARLAGTVVDGAGRAVADAVVELLVDGRPHWTRSAADGSFALEGLVPGDHEAVLLAEGHPPTTRAVAVPAPEPVRLTLDPPLAPVEPLPPVERSALSGELLPSVGSRVAGCEVVLVPAPAGDGDETLLTGTTVRRVVADGEGQFEVPDVVHGDYELRVLPDWAEGGSWPVLARASLRHDGASGPRDLLLESGRVIVRAADAAGRPVADALLLVTPDGEPGRVWPPTHTSAAGAASVGDLPPGRYRLELRAGGESAERVVEVGPGELLEVEFAPLVLR